MTDLLFIHWDVDPEIFSIGFLHVRWYGLLWALAIISAFGIVTRIFKNENRPENWSDKMFIYGALGLVLGARLGHCWFYEWQPLDAPVNILGITFTYGNRYIIYPWEMFSDIFKGHGLAGLASHGGAIGLLLAMWLYTRRVTHKSFIYIMDRLVIGVAIGGAFIRFGNLMNSEIYGGATTLPWGFIFERNNEFIPKHPTQIYEMIYCLVTFAITMVMYWKTKSYRHKGLIFGVFLICIFGTRFLLEFIKNLQEPFEDGLLSHIGLNMGQLLSLPLIIWGIFLTINALRKPAELEDFESEKRKVKSEK
jgi:prolipoprotein diacylglyceryl transferase